MLIILHMHRSYLKQSFTLTDIIMSIILHMHRSYLKQSFTLTDIIMSIILHMHRSYLKQSFTLTDIIMSMQMNLSTLSLLYLTRSFLLQLPIHMHNRHNDVRTQFSKLHSLK